MGTPGETGLGTDGVTLTEAAESLGISRDALKKRVQRGAIPAYKDETGAWRVALPQGDNIGDVSRDMGDGTSSGHVSPVVPGQLTAIMDAWLTPLTDRIAEQAEMIGRLKLENEQLRATLEATERAAYKIVQDAPYTPEQPADRESSPQTPPVAPGGAGEAERALEKPQRWPWWMRILGGR